MGQPTNMEVGFLRASKPEGKRERVQKTEVTAELEIVLW